VRGGAHALCAPLTRYVRVNLGDFEPVPLAVSFLPRSDLDHAGFDQLPDTSPHGGLLDPGD
jgi:hypothetical protein